MGLTSALNTSLNGLSLNETTIDVLGNNIANAATTGFKASSVRFQTQLSRTLSIGSRPTGSNGGTNPRQIGLGAQNSSITRDFSQGSITLSTSNSDLAIQGNGFFILDGTNGTAYTRNGNFSLNTESRLINDQGFFVQGFGVDENFQLDTTRLDSLRLPLTELQIAQLTTKISLGGALQAGGDLATQGSINLSDVLTDNLTSANATGTALLTNLRNPAGATLFTVGQEIEFSPKRGGREVTPQSLTVTATTTLNDLVSLIDGTLGIQSGGTIPNDGVTGGQPGVTIVAGQIRILSNSGTVNQVEINGGDITANGSAVPLSFARSQDANGNSVSTDFVVFDSLGQPVSVRVTATLESRTPNLTYRYYVESIDDSRTDIAVANGTLTFDTQGRPVGDTNHPITIQRDGTGATSPMTIDVDFSGLSGISPENAGSRLSLISQDGSKPGTLQSFVIDETGIINGIFDNGLIRTLGQVVLARFANPDGLVEDGGSTFKDGVSSGTAILVQPGSFGSGTIRSGAVESSNTDIGRNLVDLIVASTNYRGNARVISSVQQLVDELLALGR